MQLSFFSALAIVFILLKLLGVIGWSWWLVLLPAYGPITVALLAIVLATVLAKR